MLPRSSFYEELRVLQLADFVRTLKLRNGKQPPLRILFAFALSWISVSPAFKKDHIDNCRIQEGTKPRSLLPAFHLIRELRALTEPKPGGKVLNSRIIQDVLRSSDHLRQNTNAASAASWNGIGQPSIEFLRRRPVRRRPAGRRASFEKASESDLNARLTP
jgi:hypothetical protein